jgi:undecaprenyl-diphosphatase
MSFLEAVLYGLVQGITEFLPVSSSGHLALLGRIFATDPAAMLSLATLMHMGTLISVFVVMRHEIGAIFHDIFGEKTWKIILASIPAFVTVLLLGDFLEELFAGGFLGVSFLISGVILMGSQLLLRRKSPGKDIGYKEALVAGIGQAIAVAPGISRSGMSISALLLCGVEREKAIRFSFLMAIPAILGGFAMDVVDLFQGKGPALASLGVPNMLVGILAAAGSGYLSMRFMLSRLRRRGFLICAVYVLVLGSLILVDQSITHIFF